MQQIVNITCIETWKRYSDLSHNQHKVATQFENLLWSDFGSVHELKTKKTCCHRLFKSQQSFLDVIHGYIINEPFFVKKVSEHQNIKTGICIDCIQKFLIKTNALNDVFAKWIKFKFNKSYQYEFNNTNIMICDEPLFLKSILLKSNLNILRNVFKLFFITYLKQTNLNQFINDESKRMHQFTSYQWEFSIKHNVINRCHSFEYSFCSLSTTIISLLPLLKLFHIKHLFIDDPELRDIANIINCFGIQYTNLLHIKLYKDKSRELIMRHHRTKFEAWNKQIITDPTFARNWPLRNTAGVPVFKFNTSDLYYTELFEAFIQTKHPILQRIGHIISSLYQHVTKYKTRLNRKLLITHDTETKYIWSKLRKLRNDLKYIAFGTRKKVPPPSINDFCKGTAFENICKVSYFYHGCYVSNKELKKAHNAKLQCSSCNKSQNNIPSTKLKICGGCKLILYCNRKCQKYDWSRNQHRILCKQLQHVISDK